MDSVFAEFYHGDREAREAVCGRSQRVATARAERLAPCPVERTLRLGESATPTDANLWDKPSARVVRAVRAVGVQGARGADR